MMMAVGLVKFQSVSGRAAASQLVARICRPPVRKPAIRLSSVLCRALSTHLRAEAEAFRPKAGKGVSV
jgi:hypothetical protein